MTHERESALQQLSTIVTVNHLCSRVPVFCVRKAHCVPCCVPTVLRRQLYPVRKYRNWGPAPIRCKNGMCFLANKRSSSDSRCVPTMVGRAAGRGKIGDLKVESGRAKLVLRST